MHKSFQFVSWRLHPQGQFVGASNSLFVSVESERECEKFPVVNGEVFGVRYWGFLLGTVVGKWLS